MHLAQYIVQTGQVVNRCCAGVKKGPIVNAIQKSPFITVFPAHALLLIRYRQAFSPSSAKEDLQDA